RGGPSRGRCGRGRRHLPGRARRPPRPRGRAAAGVTMRIESLVEGGRLAIDQLRANKFRSALTIVGIVVGVATVMAMSGLIAGIRGSVMGAFEASGPYNFMVARYNFNSVRVVSDGMGPP